MKFEITKASEARKLVDEHRTVVTDRDIEDVMANINNEITRRARLGETVYTAYVNSELSKVGFRDFGEARRELVFRPIVEALRSEGYTVKVGEGYFGEGYADVTISW